MAVKARVLVADPPWVYEGGLWDRQTSKPESHYETLTVGDIGRIPVDTFLADDAYLFLWTTNRHLLTGDAGYVAERWGFRPLTILTWVKNRIGLGYYLRNTTEHVIFGVRGRPGPPNDRSIPTHIISSPGRHSDKPDALYVEIQKFSDGPYVELFARKERPGWVCWGNEVGDPLGIGFEPEHWSNVAQR